MIDKSLCESLAVAHLRQFCRDVKCEQTSDDAEFVDALALVIEQSAMMLAKLAGEDRAQCALYEPYKKLMGS